MGALKDLSKHPLPLQIQAVREAIANEYRSSLYKTVKHLLGYNEVNPRTHGKMIAALEAPTRRKLLVMPRGTFKSSVGVVGFSIWLLMRFPNLRILIDSEKYENSKNFIREIKGKVADDRFKSIFGDWKSKNWNEGEITISTRTKTLKEASITASGIGAGKVGQHYDVMIHDDLNTTENSENSEQRKKIIKHYQMNTSILEPEGTIVVIGTRYAVDDVIGFILENEAKPGLVGTLG